MLRLTKDLHTPYDDTTYADIVKNATDRENIVLTRLKHYEDIEEELGIDLITLFNVLKSHEVIRKYKNEVVCNQTIIEKNNISGLAFDDDYYGLWVYDKFGDEIFLYIKDYCKTWALTKEELEDETEEIGSTIITTFSSDEEKEIVFNLIKRHIELMPKVYRKRNSNWIIVSDLTFYGRGYSFSICSALSVDPNGYEWKKEDLEKLESF